MLDNLASFVTQLLMFCSVLLLACWVADSFRWPSSSEPDWRAEVREDDAWFLRNVRR